MRFQSIELTLTLALSSMNLMAQAPTTVASQVASIQEPCPDSSSAGTELTLDGKITNLYHGILVADDRCPNTAWVLIKSENGAVNEALATIAILMPIFDIRVVVSGLVIEQEGFVFTGEGAERRGNGFGYRGLHQRGLMVSRIRQLHCTERQPQPKLRQPQ